MILIFVSENNFSCEKKKNFLWNDKKIIGTYGFSIRYTVFNSAGNGKKPVGSHDTFNSVTTNKTQELRWKIKKWKRR